MTYPEWVRGLPCGHCIEQQTPTEFHHFKMDLHQSGAGMKSNDFLGMPLCQACHDSFHRAKWGDDWRLGQRGILILTLIKAVKEGVLVLGDIPDDYF